MAIDFDEAKLALARAFGAKTCNPSLGIDPVAAGMAFSRGRGVDGVIVTASTQSSDPMRQAAQMCRKRGRIVLVGVTGLNLNRADFYRSEEHTSELQSLMRISYAVFCLKKKKLPKLHRQQK